MQQNKGFGGIKKKKKNKKTNLSEISDREGRSEILRVTQGMHNDCDDAVRFALIGIAEHGVQSAGGDAAILQQHS